MESAWTTLTGRSIEWKGIHHSATGDFADLSTHVVSYETDGSCFVTAGGKLVGEARYVYTRFDDRMAALLYWPREYQGLKGVVLNAMLDFQEETDRAVIVSEGKPIAIAEGSIREVPTLPRDSFR